MFCRSMDLRGKYRPGQMGPPYPIQPPSTLGGEEILVLEGTFYDEHGTYPKGSWIRSPHMSKHTPFTKDEGATIYVKTGHLG